jgi:hypothetical protein
VLGCRRCRRTSRTIVRLLPGLLVLGLLLVLGAPVASAAVTVGDAEVSESNGVASATFTVTRTTGLLAGPATIHFSTADGSARAPGDYAAVTGDLQFGSAPLGGTQVQTVPVTVRGDALDESAETFRLVLSGSVEIGDAEGVATIADDDPPPVIGVADAAAAAEGDSASFTIALSAPSGREISVAFTTADADATAGEDYTALSGTVGIPAGTTTASLGVALVDDAADEPDERFELHIGSPGAATLGRATASATITDNDEPPAVPSLSSSADGTPAPPSGGPGGADGDAAIRTPADTGAAPGSSAPQLGLSSPRLRRPATVLVTVSCPRETSRCSGRVTIFSRANPRSRIKALRQERRLGLRNFTLVSGTARTLTIALARSDRVLLRRTGRMLVRAFAVTYDGSGRSRVRRANGTLIARTSHS